MFERVSQMAEQIATKASRRQFLGGFGRGAMTLAAVAAGFLALPTTSAAGKRQEPCDAGSYSGCEGRYTGDPCSGGREGGPGVCRRVHKGTTCFCG